MKIQLSESGYSKDIKDIKEIIDLSASFGKFDDIKLENSYYVGFSIDEKISKLLNKYSEQLEVYFFNNILYINIESENSIFIVEMFNKSLSFFCEEIKKNKKIYIVTYNKKKLIENLFYFDIIL